LVFLIGGEKGMKLGSRAISPLIATIILISICVAGGLLIYSVFFSSAGTLTAKGQVSIESIDLVKDSTGKATFTITIKNTGNKPTSDVTVALVIEGLQEALQGTLQGGEDEHHASFYIQFFRVHSHDDLLVYCK